MSSTVTIIGTVASIIVVSNYVKKLKFTKYQSSSVKLYLARAGVGIIPVIVLSTMLYFLLNFILSDLSFY